MGLRISKGISRISINKNRLVELYLRSRRNLGSAASCAKIEKQLMQLKLKNLKAPQLGSKEHVRSGLPREATEINDKFNFTEFMRTHRASLKNDRDSKK